MTIEKDERKEGLHFEGSRSRFSNTVTMLDAIIKFLTVSVLREKVTRVDKMIIGKMF